MLSLTVDHKGETEKDYDLEPGDKVEYLGHIVGGMVKIRFQPRVHDTITKSAYEDDIAHPHCFKELK